ncbi:MAG TPA: regulatory protein RecX [Candidatus Dormibacteraeota bacterium]
MRRRAARPQVVVDPSNSEAAYSAALKKLARQPQSRATLAQKLERQGFEPEAVGVALDRAQGDGYLNDEEFARSLVRRRSTSRGYGLIARELRAKGVEDSNAAPALGTVDRDAEAAQALELGRSMLRQRPPADRQALQALVGARLGRRGFDSGLIYRVCRQLADDWQAAGWFDSPPERD